MSDATNVAPDGDRVTRRGVLISGAGAVGGIIATGGFEAAAAEKKAKSSVYESLGVKPLINAAGTFTVLGGSLMPPEVVEAWVDASRHFVDLLDLQDKVGQRIAELLDVESALVTTGAAGALVVATAAAVTRGKAEFTRRLPDTTGMKNEVITQKAHHTCYDHQVTSCGVKLIEVQTRSELKRAINERTAMLLFYNKDNPDGNIRREEWIEVAQKHEVPTLLDAAADVPPVEVLSKYNKMGFDMVAFSGGKALLGPQDAGLLLGRKDLVESAKLNTAPRCGNIGRGMKVSKEDMIAMLAAVERYVSIDHEAEWREWERRLAVIEHTVKQIPTVTTRRIVPPIANHVPHVLIFWDENRVKITREQVTRKLAAGDPSIRLGRVSGTGDKGLLVSVFLLKPSEVGIVASRLREVLKEAVV